MQWAAVPEAQPGASGGHHLLGTARRMNRYEAVQELRSTLGGIDQSVFFVMCWYVSFGAGV